MISLPPWKWVIDRDKLVDAWAKNAVQTKVTVVSNARLMTDQFREKNVVEGGGDGMSGWWMREGL